MEGYKKVINPEKEEDQVPKNVIKVKAKGQIKNNLGYALSLFTKDNFTTIEIRGTGNAIVKALILIELVKRRLGDLHQINDITSTEIVDIYEPEVEGLERIEQKRRVTCLHCILSKEPLDQNHLGYQPPQPKEERTPNEVRERPPRQYNNNNNNNGNKRRYNDDNNEGGKPQRGGDRPQRGGDRPRNDDRQDNRRGGRGGFRGGRGGRARSGSADNRRGGLRRGGYNNDNRRGGDYNNDHRRGGGHRDEPRDLSPRENFPKRGGPRYNDDNQRPPFRGADRGHHDRDHHDRDHHDRDHYPRQNQGGYNRDHHQPHFDEEHRGPRRGGDYNDRPTGGFRGRGRADRPSFDDSYLPPRGNFGGRGGRGRGGDFNDRPHRDFDDDRNERRGPPMRRGGYGGNFDGPRENPRFNNRDNDYEPNFNDGPIGERPLRGRGRGGFPEGGDRPFRGRGGFRGGRGGHDGDHHEGGDRPFRGRGGFRGGRGGAPRTYND